MLVGASCVDIRLRAHLRLTGTSRSEVGGAAVQAGYLSLDDAMLGKLGLEVPPAEGPRPYTANTTWAELGQSGWIGWLVLSIAHPNPNPNPSPNPNPNPNPTPTPTPTPNPNPSPSPSPNQAMNLRHEARGEREKAMATLV